MRNNPFVVLPLDELIPQLSPEEAKFFAMLDVEFEKIVSFYLDREEEMQTRWRTLREQLDELGDHMKHVQVCVARSVLWFIKNLQ
jgi:SPX domain protein involved in polyphosphate accumulation